MEKMTLEGLVELMKQGEEQAFEELYKRFHASFYYMALKLCKCDADAKDAVQETFIQIHKSIESLQEPSTLIIWMKKILFSKCKNIFRKHPKEVLMDDDAMVNMNEREERIEYIPEKTVEHLTVQETLLKLIQRIPYIYQEPLVLKYYGQHTMEEIGSILDIPTGTVKSRLRTGKEALRKELKCYERGEGNYRTFHSIFLSHILTTAFAYDANKFLSTGLTLKGKSTHFMNGSSFLTGATIKAGLCIATCAVASPIAISYITGSMKEPTQNVLRHQERPSIEKSDQEIYFTLKSWAHCKEDMLEKSSDEFKEVDALFRQLEHHQGVFWELLQKDNWAENYISIKK